MMFWLCLALAWIFLLSGAVTLAYVFLTIAVVWWIADIVERRIK